MKEDFDYEERVKQHYLAYISQIQAEVLPLCQAYGYGAVMQAAAELWAKKDPVGALTIGPCRGMVPER